MPIRIFLSFTVIAAFAHASVLAQDSQREAYPESTVRVTLVDGTALVGVISSETDTTIVVRASTGVQTTIPREQVRSVESLEGRQFYRIDPNRTRLLFGPTGRPLDQGSGYIADYMLFFPFVAYGPGAGVTLAAGISLFPGVGAQLVYIAPKVTVYERGELSVAGGVLATTVLGSGLDDAPVLGLVYGVTTFGGATSWLTVGLAFGFADGRFGENPGIMVGGEIQLSNSVKLLSENYVLVGLEDAVILTGGIRFFGDRLSADLGLGAVPAMISETDGFPFFPWLGFAYNF